MPKNLTEFLLDRARDMGDFEADMRRELTKKGVATGAHPRVASGHYAGFVGSVPLAALSEP
jgi:hypothetical protein